MSQVRVAEKDVQRLILDWLSAKKIWHIRLNTGAMSGSHNGKRWFVKFGKPGMADILVARHGWFGEGGGVEMAEITWIEVKAAKGKLSEAQEQFKKEVTENGMQYVCARSLEDVKAVLESESA